MKRIALTTLLAGILIGSAACQKTDSQQVAGEAPASGTQAPAPAAAELENALAALVEEEKIPGAIAIIEQGGKRLAHVRTGYLDVESGTELPEDAIFRLYSMSKPITSVAIMILRDEGKLNLDDPVEKYLPALGDMQVYVSGPLEDMQTEPAERSITIADLLSHMSGIAYHFTGDTPVHQYYRKHGVMRDTPVGRTPEDGPPAKDLGQLVERIGDAPLLYQPGTKFEYSYSTTVLGAVIEASSGQPLDVFLEEKVFEPLDMTDTGFFITDETLDRFVTGYVASEDGLDVIEPVETSDYRDTGRLLDGGGAIAGTAHDYLNFATMLAQEGKFQGRQIVSEESIQEMFAPHAEISGWSDTPISFGYGFSLGTPESEAAGMQPAGTVSWSGSGNTYFFVDPDRDLVALLMTHVIVPPPFSERTQALRQTLNEAAYALAGDDG